MIPTTKATLIIEKDGSRVEGRAWAEPCGGYWVFFSPEKRESFAAGQIKELDRMIGQVQIGYAEKKGKEFINGKLQELIGNAEELMEHFERE